MATDDPRSALAQFAAFARSLKGDEKSEAQAFLERFFRALGHGGVIEAGATFEFRVAKKPGSSQLQLLKGDEARGSSGKKFADLLWPGRVLIEMKSRGAKLEKHYDQAFEYWQLIVPNRPRYVILCNFDEFWIYDFNEQLFDPVERVSLRELPESASAFNFLLPTETKPIFGNNRVEVTRRAADLMARVFRGIVARGEDRSRAQRFILQLLISMVGEDIDLLPRDIVTELYESSQKNGSPYDLFGGLFRQMASPKPARAGRFQNVPYFNGGIFAVVDPIDLKMAELYALHEAALHNDWSKVKPEIFGTLFQQSMDTGEAVAGSTDPGHNKLRDERHAFGAHFTSEFDIQKVVGPTIVRPWRERLETCGKDKARLRAALDDLRRFRVLDPACGSGNFLFVAYRECKRLERDLLARLKRAGAGGTFTSEVRLNQFFGIDVLPFAAELAKVTLMLAKELEIREARTFGQSEDLFIEEKALPLENLDANILCADALFTPWPAADAIIGNPPYLGAKLLKPTHGPDYAKKVRAAFPDVPGMADFCVYWFRKAHDLLAPGGRAGLVGTQNIRNNNSRPGGLDYIVQNGGVITEAVATQVWSGEAAVHVSIVNWEKRHEVANGRDPAKESGSAGAPPAVSGASPETSSESGGAAFSPGEDSAARAGEISSAGAPKTAGEGARATRCRLSLQRGDSVNSPWETYELPVINSSLSVGVDVGNAAELVANQGPPVVYNGQFPRHHGFVLTPDEARALIAADPRNAEVVRPFLIGAEMLTHGAPQRWVIDFQKRDQFAARSYAAPFDHVQTHVLPHITALAEKEKAKTGKATGQDQQWLKTWWQHFRSRKELIDRLSALPRYIACCEVTKRPIFCFIDSGIRPDHTLEAFVLADDYSFASSPPTCTGIGSGRSPRDSKPTTDTRRTPSSTPSHGRRARRAGRSLKSPPPRWRCGPCGAK